MLYTHSCGNPLRPHIVFLHGFLGTCEDFIPIIEQLKDDYFCTAIDLPGHGKSPTSHDPLKLIARCMQKLTRPIDAIAGYSMGGRIALHYSLQFNIKKQILFSAHTGLSPNKLKEQIANENYWLNALKTLPIKDFIKLWYQQPLFYSLRNRDDLFATVLKKRLQQDSLGIYSMYSCFLLSEQKAHDAMKIPTLLVYGELDGKYRDLYEGWRSKVAVEKIPYAGHAVHIENPIGCARLIDTFLQKENAYDNTMAASCRLQRYPVSQS
jgi:2-succinyl-6-hydroxy-2,4-cyclohexadiene-1-carboxylate synthase